ncbi:hypothetical protein [Microtetraspora sp. NBRC 16547]|uniref:hypothetical protein n=1 Tax=Microtetraspora sp. NBRC 16547 TaxID=3030993 RepID=UPI0024A58BE5|nr:hypothetical protein [Microtetraspora sp. NBRC 16547]GLX02132.1 hypothetical protein Misp02_62180 [Microtetraspora sp. NBRC 16547]
MSDLALPDAPARARRDLRTLGRVTAAILMPIGPACVAVIRFVIPGWSGDVGADVAAHADAQRFVLLLGIPALFTLLPGAYAAVRLGRRHRPVLTAWTAAFLIPGYLGMTVLGANDYGVLAATDIGLDPPTVTRLSDEIFGLTAVPGLVFVVGHIVGTLLLGILAFRARLAPRPVSIALAISQPLHLTAVILNYSWLDLTGWGFTAVGMGFLGVRVLRTPNDEWDLPALAVSASRSDSVPTSKG